ncbi:MAG: FHA domain-containing protein, partial [Ktedonobacterales bacterium]
MDLGEGEGAEAPGVRGAWEAAFLSGPLAGQSFPIAPPLVTIGRDEANDIVIRDDLKVSRLHARLRWKDDRWRIENISRSSFIQVDGQREQAADLVEGAIAHLGDDSSFMLRALPTAADDGQPTAAANAADAADESDAPATPAEPARVGQTGQR